MEQGRMAESLDVVAGNMPSDTARETGSMIVRKWDDDATNYASRQLGGRNFGNRGFIQPQQKHFRDLRINPYETVVSHGNLLTQAGWGRILTLALGTASTGWTAASARIGVGTATAAATTGQSDLSAATGSANRIWVMCTGVGTTASGSGGGGQITWVGQAVGASDGNWAWAEWGIDQGAASGYGAVSGVLLNRAVTAQGTKTSGSTWTSTAVLTFT